MGQTPPKYFMPQAPYGASVGANVVNPVQPAAVNPQTPGPQPSASAAPQNFFNMNNPLQQAKPPQVFRGLYQR